MTSEEVIVYLVARYRGTETGKFERERVIVVYRSKDGVGHVRAAARWVHVNLCVNSTGSLGPVLSDIEVHHRGR